MSPVDFAKEKNWDILLVDEAQDLTPATIDLIMKTSCAKIFVGDPHQQIYSFRGATNAMPLVTANHTFYLTRVSSMGERVKGRGVNEIQRESEGRGRCSMYVKREGERRASNVTHQHVSVQ